MQLVEVGSQLQVNLRMRTGEFLQVWNQPTAGQCRLNSHPDTALVSAAQLLRGPLQALENIPHPLGVLASRLRQLQALTLAHEQAHTKLIFQTCELTADRALGHTELFTGTGDAATACDRVKTSQGAGRGQPDTHGSATSCNLVMKYAG